MCRLGSLEIREVGTAGLWYVIRTKKCGRYSSNTEWRGTKPSPGIQFAVWFSRMEPKIAGSHVCPLGCTVDVLPCRNTEWSSLGNIVSISRIEHLSSVYKGGFLEIENRVYIGFNISMWWPADHQLLLCNTSKGLSCHAFFCSTCCCSFGYSQSSRPGTTQISAGTSSQFDHYRQPHDLW